MSFFAAFKLALPVVTVVWSVGTAYSAETETQFIDVASAAELSTAMNSIKGGETIRLAPGQYGELRLSGTKGKLSNTVTIVSANAAKRAVFGVVSLKDVSNLRFVDLMFDYVAKYGASQSGSPFKVIGSSGITFENIFFDGDLARGVNSLEDGYGTGRGLVVRMSDHITVKNCSFRNWYRAAAFGGIQNLSVLSNEVVASSSDALNFTQVEDVLIDGNHLHDFNRAPGSSAHSDMIQFWTAGSKATSVPSKNVTIINNFLDMGAGSSAQAIFMRNERVDQGTAGFEMFYKNIVISNNVIATRHQHGITVGETDGLLIDRNTVIQKAGPRGNKEIPRPTIKVSKNAVNVTVTNNISSALGGGALLPPQGWTVENNIVVQAADQNMPYFVGKILVNPLVAATASRADFMVAPESSISRQHIGAKQENVEPSTMVLPPRR